MLAQAGRAKYTRADKKMINRLDYTSPDTLLAYLSEYWHHHCPQPPHSDLMPHG